MDDYTLYALMVVVVAWAAKNWFLNTVPANAKTADLASAEVEKDDLNTRIAALIYSIQAM